jgi:hypothetical protein
MSAEDVANKGSTSRGKRQVGLETLVAHWPTVTVNGNWNRAGLSPTSGDGLQTAAKNWPPPVAQDSKDCGAPAEFERNSPGLIATAVLSGLQAPKATGAASPPVSSRLNTAFVEWLMGWPEGWSLPWSRFGPTGSDCSVTESYPRRLLRLGAFSGSG